MKLSHIVNPCGRIQEWIVEQFLTEVSICPCCGRWGASPFCKSCWECHRTLAKLKTVPVSGKFKTQSLFQWDEGQQKWVGDLIHGLKGGLRKRMLEELAWIFVMDYFRRFPQVSPDALIVPAPARRSDGRRDHARAWAEQIAKILGLKVWYGLKRSHVDKRETAPQKLKTSAERRSITLMASEPAPPHPMIFVDDVVTTGATAKAAWEALKPQHGYEVWCIAYRMKTQNQPRAYD